MTLRQYIVRQFGSVGEYKKFMRDWSTTCAVLNRSVDNPNWMRAREWARRG